MKKTLIFLFFLICTAGRAQVFPVQVNVQLTPPYSPYLSDYTAPGAQRFMVHIRPNDVTISNYACKLRITIEGVGITIRTKENFISQPIILEGGGIPQTLYGDDLHEYLHPDALDFSGFSRWEYQKSSRLPEGIYRFKVEVLDYNRGTVVSNPGMTMAWIFLNDPPLLNVPANHSKIKLQDPVNILFSWTPRHTGSPNAAFTTEYTFRLVELWPENRNPYDAFLTQEPVYETTTTQNQILYGMSESPLLPGRKYAWQVEARTEEGKDLFKNNGRSEVFVFQYGDALAAPRNLHMRWAKPRTLAIRWDKVWTEDAEELKYRLAYRPRRRIPDHQWYETRTKFTDKTLYDLEPDTEYEVKVRTENSVQESEYTETLIFKTLAEEPDAFVCRDDITPPPPPDNTDPVFPLSVNDTIHAGGYAVLVRDVMKVENKYFGSGYAIVPWFNSAKVRVTFENIRVNDRFWLTSGTIKSVWNAQSEFLFEEQAPVLPGKTPQAGALDITVISVDSLISVEGKAIASVTRDEEGNIVLTTTDGEDRTLAKGETYAIVDEVGNGYVVHKEGNIAKTTATEATAAAARGNRSYDLKFSFARGPGKFGFDEKQFEGLSQYYQQIGDGVYAAWKALSSSGPDQLEGRLESSGKIPADALRFEAGSAVVAPTANRENVFTFSLQGKAAGMEEEFLALHQSSDTVPPRVLGKVNLVSYNPIRHNLVIVPVNNATIPAGLTTQDISEDLNEVFSQAVVEWSVQVHDGIDVPLGATFDEGETGLFSNYTDDMKKVLKAFGRLQENTYYLFLIDEPRDPSTLGYMPRNRRAGFVFVKPHEGSSATFLKTIAHELGHGAFNLKHTFSEHPLPSGTTDNLMDYSPGTKLYKYQWDQVHQPQAVMGLFEGEGESESVIVSNLAQLKPFANADGSFTFLAPTGVPFTLPAVTQNVKFWTNDAYSDRVIKADETPDGALIAFTIDNVTYRYHKIEGETSGTGYKIQKGDLAYIDALTVNVKNLTHAIIALPCVENGELKFIAQQAKFESDIPKENHTAEGPIAQQLPIEDPYGPYFSSAKIPLEAKLSFTYSAEARSFLIDNQACLNEMVRYVIKAADVIQNNPGHYELYKVCTGSALIYPDRGSSTTEDAFKMGIYYERLKSFDTELLEYIHQSTYAREHLLDITDADALGRLLSETCEPDFRLFTFEQRAHILNILATGKMHDYWLGFGNNRENIVIYTLQQAPEDQHGDLLDLLQNNSYALLKTLIVKTDNQLVGQDNFDKLIDAITVMIQKQYVYESFEEDVVNDRILRWGSTGFLHSFNYECPDWANSSKNKIEFSYTSTSLDVTGIGEITGSASVIPSETVYPRLEVSPFDYVAVKVYSDVLLDNGTPILKRSAGEVQAIPAIYLYWMIHRKATDETLAYIKANVNLALFLVGGAEIIAARTGFRLALAIADQTLFATSFALDAGPRQLLEEGPNGEEWKKVFKAFDAFNMLYGAARLGQGLTLAAQDVLANKELITNLRQTEDWARYTPAQRALVEGEIVKVEKGVEELEGMVKANTLALQSVDLASVLNKLPTEVRTRVSALPSDQLDELLLDLHHTPELLSKMTVNMVSGWEVLANNPVLRKKAGNLELIGMWVAKGVSKESFVERIQKTASKQRMISLLKEAKSRLHVQVLIKDYENIPGVVRGRYVANFSTALNKQTKPSHWPAEYDIDEEVVKSFTGDISPFELQPGEKIYRVSTFFGGGGPYWTRTKPTTLTDVIGGTAVRPEWNDFRYLYEYEVPEGVTIKCWIGNTARQPIEKNVSANYYLPGGDEQMYIYEIAEQDKTFTKSLQQTEVQWQH